MKRYQKIIIGAAVLAGLAALGGVVYVWLVKRDVEDALAAL